MDTSESVDANESDGSRTGDDSVGCPLEPVMQIIAGRWKAEITWHLCGTTRRFNELRRLLPGITPKMLTQQLRALERDGIISRTQYNEIPPRVEYRTTALGDTLGPVFSTLGSWGIHHADEVEAARHGYDNPDS